MAEKTEETVGATENGKKKPKRERAQKQHLPGMEPPRIKELDKAARSYVQTRDERMALTKDEVNAKTLLLELMKKHQLTVYDTPEGQKVVVSSGPEQVTVRAAKEDTDE